MKKLTLVTATLFLAMALVPFVLAEKKSSCATVKIDGQTVAMRGGPPLVWKADGTMANEHAVRLHYARGVLANPGLTRTQKMKLISPETAAELEAPWLTNGDPKQGDPRPPKGDRGGSSDDGPCQTCPQFGCPCPCWGTLTSSFQVCDDAAIDCRKVTPDCPL